MPNETDPTGILLGVFSAILIIVARAIGVFLESRKGKKAVRSLLETDETPAVEESATAKQLTDALAAMTRMSDMALSLNSELREERGLAKKEREEWRAERLALEKRVAELENARETLSSELDRVRRALEAAKADYEKAHDDMNAAQSAANRYRVENQALKEDRNRLQHRVEELESELARLKTDLEIATARITDLEKIKTGELRALPKADADNENIDKAAS